MLKAKVNTAPIRNFYADLLKKFGKDTFPKILRNEAIQILRATLKKEKTSKVSYLSEIGSRSGFNKFDYEGAYKISINSGTLSGRKNLSWFRVSETKWLPLGIYDGNKGYAPIDRNNSESSKKEFAEQFNRARGQSSISRKRYAQSRGSTAALFKQAMDEVKNPSDNTDTKVAAFIEKSQRLDGKPRASFVNVSKTESKLGYKISGQINSAILSKNGAQFRLAVAMANRQKFFKRAIKNGWLDDARFLKKNNLDFIQIA